MTTIQSPVFTTEAGAKLSRITTNRQLQKFLSQNWEQKSLRIDGAPGLTIHQSGRWHFNIMTNGQRLSTTLGRYPEVSLADARNKALEMRRVFLAGTKPTKKKSHLTGAIKHHHDQTDTESVTVNELLPEFLHYRYEALLASKTNKFPNKSVQTLEARYHKHLEPHIGHLHPSQVTNRVVIACLSPLELRKAERDKCQAIISEMAKWFLKKKLLDADNYPLRLDVIHQAFTGQPPPAKHHARMNPADVPRLVDIAWSPQPNIRDQLAALGLLLVLLTAQRVGNFLAFDSNEIVEKREWYSQWKDIDMNSRTWSIPAECRKVSQKGDALVAPLRIPITDEMAEIFDKIKICWKQLGIELGATDFVLPSYRDLSHPQKSATVRRLLKFFHDKDLKDSGQGFFDPEDPTRVVTPHGLRSTFEDWALAQGFSSKFVEKALDHSPPSQIEAAYQRSDFLEERRPMMEAWSKYCFSLVRKKK